MTHDRYACARDYADDLHKIQAKTFTSIYTILAKSDMYNFGSEAIAIRLEAIAIRLEAIASR